jgi:hypothetical protein
LLAAMDCAIFRCWSDDEPTHRTASVANLSNLSLFGDLKCAGPLDPEKA